MRKKITSLFLVVMYLIMCANIVAFAADAYVDGPEKLYIPMDSSYTSVTYVLRDESGNIIDNSQVSWSVDSPGILLLEDGELLLNKDTTAGVYNICANYDGAIFTKSVTLVSGFYDDFSAKNDGFMSTASRIPTSSSVIGAKGDYFIDFDYKYETGANAVALYITTKDQANDYSVPMYMRSNSDKYLIRFLNYVDGITRQDKDYVVQKNYGEWANVKIYVKFNPATDNDVAHMTYDVYFDKTLVFENLRPANTTSTPYDGFRTVVIRQSGFHVDNFKIYSGHPIDISDGKYKYIGLEVTGEDNIGTSRNGEPVYVTYNITNMFGNSVSDEASWSVSPSSQGVSVSADGTLCVTKEATEGVYTLSAVVNGREYSKEITLSAVDYNLVVSGADSYIKDHTFEGESFAFEANDQFGTPVKTTWELVGNSDGVSLNQTGDNACELYVSPSASEGVYSIKAIADPSENMTVSEYTKTFELISATYSVHGPDSVKKPASGYETVTFTLKSEIGNDVTDGTEWKCDLLPLLKDGIALVDASAPNTADVSVSYNGVTYNKTVSIGNTSGTSGESFNGTLCYNGAESMSLLSDVTDMKLEALLVSDVFTGVYKDVEWSVVGLSGDISATPDNVYINDSKLFIKGKKLGTVSLKGQIKNSTLSTDVVNVNLMEAFTSLEGSELTVKGKPNEVINVYHYMPAEGNFYDSLSATSSVPVQKDVEISSTADPEEVNLDLSKTGMHKIRIEKESGEVNEYTVLINSDKLFEQNNLAVLLADPAIEPYLETYSDLSDNLISSIMGIMSDMDASDIEKLALLSKNNMKLFPASVFAIDFLKGNKDNLSVLKTEMADNNLDTSWLDVYAKDSKYASLNSIVYNKITSVDSIDDIVILTAVEKCNSVNSKEIKPYLALIDSPKYNNADTSGKNYIASKVCGKVYDSLDELAEDIASIVIPSSSGGSGGSSGGGSKHQSGTIGSVLESVQNADTGSLQTNTYKDLSSGHWAYTYIKHLSDNNIINGYSDNSFAPENNVTRAEFLKILVSAFGIKTDSVYTAFEDVSNTAWFASYVSAAAEKGLIKGDGKYFRPDEFISRQDAAVMICRFINYKGIELNTNKVVYQDSVKIADYALESVHALTNLGIIGGMPDGGFAPVSNTTRAEAAKMIYLAMDKGGVR